MCSIITWDVARRHGWGCGRKGCVGCSPWGDGGWNSTSVRWRPLTQGPAGAVAQCGWRVPVNKHCWAVRVLHPMENKKFVHRCALLSPPPCLEGRSYRAGRWHLPGAVPPGLRPVSSGRGPGAGELPANSGGHSSLWVGSVFLHTIYYLLI